MKLLGELLINKNFITHGQLKRALGEQKLRGGRLGTNLVRLGYINEEQLLSFLSSQYKVPSIRISRLEVDPNVIKLIPPNISEKYFVIPINRVGLKLAIFSQLSG